MSQEDRFNDAWGRRRNPPYVTKSWVDNDWAKGRTDWLTILIRIRDHEIINKIISLQNELSDFKCIEPIPVESFHFTIKELAFLAEEKQNPDEMTQEELNILIPSVEEKTKDFHPFEIEIKNLNQFHSVVCFEGHDSDVINKLNGAMVEIDGVPKYSHDYPGFLPHLSFMQYKSSEDFKEVIRHLEDNRERCIGSLFVDSFELVIAELPVKERYPKLKPVHKFQLK